MLNQWPRHKNKGDTMRLMLLIIGIVLGGYVLSKAFSRRKLKKQSLLHEEFEQTILENTHSQYHNMQHNEQISSVKVEHDPLLDDFAKSSSATVDYIGKFKQETASDNLASFEEELMEIDEEFDESEEVKEPSIKKGTEKHGISQAQDFFAVTIIPKQNGVFSGNTLLGALTKNHFRYGKQKLYHRHVLDNPSQPVLYSVASLVNPGFFEQEKMHDQAFAGILIYMITPGAFDPINTFEKMLTSARQLSAILQAQLCDDKRNPLSTKTIQEYRERIKANLSLQSNYQQKESQRW
jgi:cell division protein ZipA